MAARRSFSAWLHGRRHNKKTPEEPAAAPPVTKEEPQKSEFRLDVPPDHPLMALWRLSGQKHPRPELAMRLPENGPDTPDAQENPLRDTEDFMRDLTHMEVHLRNRAQEIAEDPGREDGAVPDRDAQVNLFLTNRRLTAWVYVFPPIGQGAELNAEMLAAAFKRADLCYGVDEALADRLPRAADRYFRFFLAAVGQPPLDGRDGYVIDLFPRSQTSLLTADGAGVDFDSGELFQSARKGDVICKLVAPTTCRDGITVQNKICYATAGKPASLPAGRNTRISEDGLQLLAGRDGHVEYTGHSFQVKAVMDVAGNVDASTGDINCLGDLHIHGDICSGFNVRATGSIIVDGVVESSAVEAGGDLLVRKGVVGNDQAVLRSYRKIFAKFIENSNVYAKEALETECVIGCQVYSDGCITVRSGRGTIIGGSIRATKLVSANIVGGRSEQLTHIILGGRPFERFERNLLEKRVRELERELGKLAGQDNDAEQAQTAERMKTQLSVSRLRLQKYDKALEDMTDGPQNSRGELKAGALYPGVKITAGESSLQVRERTLNCTAYLDEGEMKLHF